MDCDDKWTTLPHCLRDEIFSYLSIADRFHAALVRSSTSFNFWLFSLFSLPFPLQTCTTWHSSFHSPNVWSHLIVDDRFLSELTFNYYNGWQFVLNNERLQKYLRQFGRHIKQISIRPRFSFTKFYQFLIAFTWFIDNIQQVLRALCLHFFLFSFVFHSKIKQNDVAAMPRIRNLSFVFPCDEPIAEDPNGIKLFGIGGNAKWNDLLSPSTRLMSKKFQVKWLHRWRDFVRNCCIWNIWNWSIWCWSVMRQIICWMKSVVYAARA